MLLSCINSYYMQLWISFKTLHGPLVRCEFYFSRFLKAIDRFNDLVVSVYVTAGHTRFMLLHDSRNDDGIKSFFQEVHELYIKILLNPLYLPGSRITSSHFDTKVRALARKYL
ncbi:trafficking protein particle complex subunit 2-like isoform X2 [Durio zibethinus]|uniref:Trafficking protein particle complex subunit 2-like isoform X2 n=1 Tax=Durio zibethinus TaxID=66656 RepID=A0A6P6A9R3_DURZI|nr:trafficking protein particle complex subunit 2-like isoform X2 [Durio zibethinus]